ncbi:MAG: CPBP family intramembrane glutamic endopeptidase [Acidobacteriota bacterium]
MTEDLQVVAGSTQEQERPDGMIAPLWHTLALLALLFLWAYIGRDKAAMSEVGPHGAVYLSAIITSWLLMGAVVAGVYQRRMFFVSTLERKASSWPIEFAKGVGIYFGFGLLVLFLAGFALMIVAVATAHGRDIATSMKDLMNWVRPHFSSNAQKALGPRNVRELCLWLGVSVTAGICEEHVFRGYLLQQAVALTRRLPLRLWMAQAIAVVATSLLFGSLHLYQGVGGAMVVTLLGCFYAACVLYFGNLRAVMVAHALQDFIAGIMVLALRHHGM